MKQHKNNLHLLQQINLIGHTDHRRFLAIQAEYGFAQRGGSLPASFRLAANRLVSDINLLNYYERKQLIHSEPISKN